MKIILTFVVESPVVYLSIAEGLSLWVFEYILFGWKKPGMMYVVNLIGETIWKEAWYK
jgi:hypothetical protein